MKNKTKKRIGCIGFSANPPQVGHLRIAQILLSRNIVDEVWMIPCGEHKFKKNLMPKEHRWEMAKLMERPRIVAKDFEIQHKGKSFTINTLRNLEQKFPTYEFISVLGTDHFTNGEHKNWKEWDYLEKNKKFIVIPRAG